MTTLFAGNTLGSIIPSSNKFSFSHSFYAADTKFTPRGELRATSGATGLCPLTSPILLGESVWVHMRVNYYTIYGYGNNPAGGPLFYLGDETNPIIRAAGYGTVKGAGASLFVGASVLDASTIDVGGLLARPTQRVTETLDVHVTLDPAIGKLLLYRSGALVSSYYGDTTVSGQVTQLSGLYLAGLNDQAFITEDIRFSEVFVSTEKTIGRRLADLGAVSDGAVTQWAGSYADINSPSADSGLSISSDVVGDTQLMGMADLDVAIPATMSVASLITSMSATSSGSGAANAIKHVVAEGGVTTESSLHSLLGNTPITQTEWTTNPRTGLAWTKADIDAVEVGPNAQV